jgi:hypothetical protein
MVNDLKKDMNKQLNEVKKAIENMDKKFSKEVRL